MLMKTKPCQSQKKRRMTVRHLVIAAAITSMTSPLQANSYSMNCNAYADMAANFVNLKTQGYSLNEVMSVIQKKTATNSSKEQALSDLAFEIFLNDIVDNENEARKVADSLCPSYSKGTD